MSTEQIRALDQRREANRKRQALLRKRQAEWVADTQLTREELAAKLASLREEMYERHPELRVAS